MLHECLSEVRGWADADRRCKTRKSRSLRRINKNDRFNLHLVVITVVVGGGGSAIKKSAIKIDRWVRDHRSWSLGRASDARSLERAARFWVSSSRLSVCLTRPRMQRRRQKTVSFQKERCYFRSDVLGFYDFKPRGIEQLTCGSAEVRLRPRACPRSLSLSLSILSEFKRWVISKRPSASGFVLGERSCLRYAQKSSPQCGPR